ncbi:uncharacterized protein A4U43_C08F35530 [Asparagus officinalis]|uniref:transcription initiation factor IIA large subunit-like isoform X2 n=1 Tax=Asparagus officinalis TaxID=4686 RepID=UPI00098E46FF|nr:transcription initiation factor IIA large subunit-like isoform X2 [Asparagus officinalis]ONK61976.1 uncharacterized protein A4U43_C08F35530 [Asparagus officinalis]
MSSSVSTVYIQVIDDVVGKVRDEFINSGAGEAVLSELQALWEMKMLQYGAISGNIERPSVPKQVAPGQVTPVHDLNVPYEGPIEEYETPTADMLFPPTPLQTPTPTPLPGTGDGMYNIPTGPSDYAPSPLSDVRNGTDVKSGRNSPYMQSPSPWMSHRPLGVDVNVAYDEGRAEVDRGAPHQSMTQDFFTAQGKRKRDAYAPPVTSGSQMPQQDGSGDGSQFKNLSARFSKDAVLNETLCKEARASLLLPQQDGNQDEYDELFPFQGVASEDYNSNTPADHELRAPTPSVGTPKPSKGEAADDDEPPLNEDDDDDEDLDDLEQGEEEPQIQHLVLAQFDKVSRTKNRWKCTLKDGIMHLNSRDVLFNKANGEFEF